jgi:hypothetical protein
MNRVSKRTLIIDLTIIRDGLIIPTCMKMIVPDVGQTIIGVLD